MNVATEVNLKELALKKISYLHSYAIILLYMWYIWQTISLVNWDVMHIRRHFS